MQRRHARIAGAALIALGLFATFALGLPRGPSAEHACCREAPTGVATAPSPCQGLLPLACCDGSAIPSAPADAKRIDTPVALPLASSSAPGAAAAVMASVARPLAPRASPLLRTIVLQL